MNPNTEFERFTQRIYQKLVNNDVLKPTKVQHNVKLKGKSGCEHQIDVYWEYEIAGNMHRVAIECKNYDSLVPLEPDRSFGRIWSLFSVLATIHESACLYIRIKFLTGRITQVLGTGGYS